MTNLNTIMNNIKRNSEQINQLTQGILIANSNQDHKSMLMLSAISMQILTEGHDFSNEAANQIAIEKPTNYSQLFYLNAVLNENGEAIKNHNAVLKEIGKF